MKQMVQVEVEVSDGYEFAGFTFPYGEGIGATFYPTYKKIKPTKKVIDLSMLVGSGIDCEFSDDNDFSCPAIGDLELISDDYKKRTGSLWKFCRVRQSPHVHFWGGGDNCPLPEGLIVKLHMSDGLAWKESSDYLDKCYWDKLSRHVFVIGFEVMGVAETHRHEWEEE